MGNATRRYTCSPVIVGGRPQLEEGAYMFHSALESMFFPWMSL